MKNELELDVVGAMRVYVSRRDNVRATQAGLNKKMTDAEMRELLKPPPLIPLSRADIQKKARIMMLQRSAHAEAEQRWMDDYVGRGVP